MRCRFCVKKRDDVVRRLHDKDLIHLFMLNKIVSFYKVHKEISVINVLTLFLVNFIIHHVKANTKQLKIIGILETGKNNFIYPLKNVNIRKSLV